MRSACVSILLGTGLAGLAAGGMRAADATSPVDATQRNTPYAPAASVVPEKQSPAAKTDPRLQDRRVDKPTVERKASPLGEQRASLDLRETRDKTILEKNSRRPEGLEQPRSGFNHQPAEISTGADTTKPPLVAKYQDSLTAATASNMARFPALDKATTAKINRFVFRKNPTTSAGVTEGAPVTPAAGGSAIQK